MTNGEEFLTTGMKVAKIVEREIGNEAVLEKGKRVAESLGLEVTVSGRHYVYMRDDIHRLLGEGSTVYGVKQPSGLYCVDEQPSRADTHTAVLIGIKPIKVESREEQMEKLLREVIGKSCLQVHDNEFYERAKKLLGESK